MMIPLAAVTSAPNKECLKASISAFICRSILASREAAILRMEKIMTRMKKVVPHIIEKVITGMAKRMSFVKGDIAFLVWIIFAIKEI
jgi:hypothetical protein